jgi:hypothetical protein
VRDRGEQTAEVSTGAKSRVRGLKILTRGEPRKHLNAAPAPTSTAGQTPTAEGGAQTWQKGIVNPSDIVGAEARRGSGSTPLSNDIGGSDLNASQHVPHSICKHEARAGICAC